MPINKTTSSKQTRFTPSPDPQSDFDFLLSGPPGVERLKVIALRGADDSKRLINFFPTEDSNFQSIPNPKRLEIEEKILTYLHQLKPTDWTVASQVVGVHQANLPEPPNFGNPFVIPPDYEKGDTVYIKDKSYMYFAEVTDEIDANAETVVVDIFNEELHKKLGNRVPAELVLGRRVEPEGGWGNRLVMLSFYRRWESGHLQQMLWFLKITSCFQQWLTKSRFKAPVKRN